MSNTEPQLPDWAVLSAQAEQDPPAVAAMMAQLPEGTQKCALMERVAACWARTDLTAAVEWFGSLPGGPGKTEAGVALGYETARTDPVLGLDLLSRLEASPTRDQALVHAVGQWACLKPEEAAKWAQLVPEPELRDRLVAAVAVHWAEEDGHAAAELAAREIRNGEQQQLAAVAVVQRWAQNSSSDAEEWASRFPDAGLRDAAVEALQGLNEERPVETE